MPLDPKAQQLLDDVKASGRPNAHLLPVETARENFEALFAGLGPGPDVHEVLDAHVPVEAGTILARIYRPSPEPGPLVVYFHGGGWLLGSVQAYDLVCRQLAQASGCVVASVDYRLGPEHRFPTAVDDAWSATTWLVAQAPSLGADPRRVAVAGDSAGGNLAAVVALQARDAGGPAIAFQLLVYPVVSTDPGTLDTTFEGYFLYGDELDWHRRNYLRDPADADDWRASPLDAVSHAGLPPALILTAECDLLHRQGELYRDRLQAAGVPVQLREFPGMIHGYFGLGAVFDVAEAAMQDAGAALRDALR